MTTLTTEEIIEMAKDAGLRQHIPFWSDSEVADALEAFAKLVEDKVRQEIIEKNAPVIKKVNEHIKELQDAVKAEREACVELVDAYAKNNTDLADAIRARSQQ